MLKLIPLVVVSIVALSPSLSRAEWPGFPFVYAEGEAEVDIPPERATITFNVVSFNKDSAVALDTLQTQLKEALAIFEAAGIPEDQITGFNLRKTVERAQDDYQDLEILGYYLSREFAVELAELTKFSSLIAELMAVDNVTSVYADFDVDDRDRIEAELVQKAGADARLQAENMAIGMGVDIDSVFAISERPIDSLEPRFSLGAGGYASVMRMSAGKSVGEQETIFLPDTINIHETVNVMFKLDVR